MEKNLKNIKKIKKILLLSCGVLIGAMSLSGCGKKDEKKDEATQTEPQITGMGNAGSSTQTNVSGTADGTGQITKNDGNSNIEEKKPENGAVVRPEDKSKTGVGNEAKKADGKQQGEKDNKKEDPKNKKKEEPKAEKTDKDKKKVEKSKTEKTEEKSTQTT